MRVLGIAGALALLAACGSGTEGDGAPATPAPEAQTLAANEVLLRADGIAAGAESFFFNAGQSEVEGALGDALGMDPDIQLLDECGAGPITALRYGDGLTVHFQDNALVGWSINVDDAGEGPQNVSLDGPVQLGTARSEVEAAAGFAMAQDSTLGEEFTLGDQISGFFEGENVRMLYAGAQCFFR